MRFYLNVCNCRFSLLGYFGSSGILNLTNEEIPKHYKSLLNLGQKFAPANKNLPLMDIITSTESCTLDMEQNHKENEAETLGQNVSNILRKNLNLKTRSNLKKMKERH